MDTAIAHTLHEIFQQAGVVLGHGHVIEEEQRLSPATQGVVDTHRHQVDADRLVVAHGARHLELCAHPVGARDQDWVLVVSGEEAIGEVEAKQAGEPVGQGYDAGTEGPAQESRQPGHRLAINVQVDARIFIGDFRHKCSIIFATKAAKGLEEGLGPKTRYS